MGLRVCDSLDCPEGFMKLVAFVPLHFSDSRTGLSSGLSRMISRSVISNSDAFRSCESVIHLHLTICVIHFTHLFSDLSTLKMAL